MIFSPYSHSKSMVLMVQTVRKPHVTIGPAARDSIYTLHYTLNSTVYTHTLLYTHYSMAFNTLNTSMRSRERRAYRGIMAFIMAFTLVIYFLTLLVK